MVDRDDVMRPGGCWCEEVDRQGRCKRCGCWVIRVQVAPPLDACVIIKRGGLFLGVSRSPDNDTWGLPVGKIEWPELPFEGAAREVMEETGLKLETATLIDIRRWAGHHIYCYFAERVTGTVSDDETLLSRDEYVARWLHPIQLFRGEFGEYNRAIFEAYGLTARPDTAGVKQ